MKDYYGHELRTIMSVLAFICAMIAIFAFDNTQAFWACLIISTIWDASK